MGECVEVLCDVCHYRSFIRSHITDILNIKKRLALINAFWVDLRQCQFFLLRRRLVQSFDGGCVAVMYCIAVNLDGIDRSMRSYNKTMKTSGVYKASPSDQLSISKVSSIVDT